VILALVARAEKKQTDTQTNGGENRTLATAVCVGRLGFSDPVARELEESKKLALTRVQRPTPAMLL